MPILSALFARLRCANPVHLCGEVPAIHL